MRHSATLIECHLWDDDDPIEKMEQYLQRKALFTPRLKRNTKESARGVTS